MTPKPPPRTAKPEIRVQELRTVRVGDLIPNPENWREHPDTQRAAFMDALDTVGFADAPKVWESPDGLMIIDGHLRTELLDPDAEIPVQVLNVNEAEARYLLATYDPLALMAMANKKATEAIIARAFDAGNASTAGIADRMRELVEASLKAARRTAQRTDPDSVPDPRPDATTRPGDIWILGQHRLICGDATSAEDMTALLDGVVPDLMITDPPYGVAYAGGSSNAKKRTEIEGDEDADLYAPILASCPAPVAYIWFSSTRTGEVWDAIRSGGWECRMVIVWNKLSPHYGALGAHYKNKYEPLAYIVRPGRGAKWIGPSNETSVWDIVQPRRNPLHPTQKPVEVMQRAISNHDAAAIYDPFIGSGTTIIAAESEGRACYGMEIDPVYVDVAVRRWQEFTGEAGRLESTGETL